MRYTVLISIFLFSIFISCKKDQFKEKPTLTFERVNTTQLHQGQVLTFTLSFTHKGKINGDLLVQELVLKCSNVEMDSINTTYPLPDFPAVNNNKGEITVSYGYYVTGYSPVSPPKCPNRNDTAVFRFVLRSDSAQISDTVSSPPVVIYNQ